MLFSKSWMVSVVPYYVTTHPPAIQKRNWQSCQVQMIKNLEVVGGVREGKKQGGRKKFARLFGLCPTSNLPPPSPKYFLSVYHFRGQKYFSGTINCQYCTTFKRILHDYLYLNNKLRAFLFPTFCPTYVEYLPDFSTLGQLPPGPYAYAPPPPRQSSADNI
jgi:hypothetical protein